MCLSPIWTDKYETARRLPQRIEVVLEAARFRSGENPVTAVKDAQVPPKSEGKAALEKGSPHALGSAQLAKKKVPHPLRKSEWSRLLRISPFLKTESHVIRQSFVGNDWGVMDRIAALFLVEVCFAESRDTPERASKKGRSQSNSQPFRTLVRSAAWRHLEQDGWRADLRCLCHEWPLWGGTVVGNHSNVFC